MAFTDYSQAFQGAEQKYGLPPGTLGGIGYVESRYNPQAVSPKGAQGLMQFMPTTAKNLGLSNPFDPNASIDAAGNLMHQNLAATHGSLQNALMMYNAGTNPSKWQPSYAEQVQSHMQPPNPYYQQPQPQPGGQPQMPPQPQMAPMSLAGLQNTAPMQSQAPSLASLAQGPPPGSIPAKSHSKLNIGNIAGILGDALSAYGGRQPTFGPMLNQEHMMEQQQGFEREKFNQELQMRIYAMTHPADIMESQIIQGMPAPQQRAYLKTQDMKNPLYTTLNGSQVLQKRVQDPPTEAVAHLRGAIGAGGDQASEFAKFNQIFGPGAAEEALGAQ